MKRSAGWYRIPVWRTPAFSAPTVHGDYADGSDLDLLVDPLPDTSLLALSKLQIKMEASLGVKVDLRTPKFLTCDLS